ncbi:hypothetical protein FRC20_006601 [Serendipita sp. 405]|nr:hypothetical protein FRC15_007478 [Serendipita sp. 397]KAG8837768.1 hypothetical protein FRC20_006601 [Serendipita sp. 405]
MSRGDATFGYFSAPPRIAKCWVPQGFNEQLRVEEGVYYVLQAANEVALDAFIAVSEHMYLFQFTSGKRHGIKPHLYQDVLNRLHWHSTPFTLENHLCSPRKPQ